MSLVTIPELSVKHISDNQFLNKVIDAYYGGTELPKSLMEVSWNVNPKFQGKSENEIIDNGGNDHNYRSDAITMEALSVALVHPTKNLNFDFHGTKTFHDDVFFNGLSVCRDNRNYHNESCGPLLSSPCFEYRSETETPNISTEISNSETKSLSVIETDKLKVINKKYLNEQIDKLWETMGNTMFPVSSIYLTTTKAYDVSDGITERCPLDKRTQYGRFGEWKKIEGYYMLASGTFDGVTYDVTNTISAGLPNIEGKVSMLGNLISQAEGALVNSGTKNGAVVSDATYFGNYNKIKLDAQKGGAYYNQSNNDVKMKSYVIDIWRRTS